MIWKHVSGELISFIWFTIFVEKPHFVSVKMTILSVFECGNVGPDRDFYLKTRNTGKNLPPWRVVQFQKKIFLEIT